MHERIDVGSVLEHRYRLGPVIARGGMSTVYRGMDLRLDRPVAVKVMDSRFAADPGFLTRFELEARSVARLRHPGLVEVYDQGSDFGHPFLVMELVEGGTLRELLVERGPMPPHAAAAVLEPLADALGVAHRAGLVHRDIKPENVLISNDGAVKIADFGLVRALASAGTTSQSVILGTAAYVSPEQVTTGSTDPRSDVYSAGVLLYEVLTGVPAFSADTPLSLAYQRVHSEVPSPSESIEGVPPEFDELVAIACAREPEDRYADGRVFAEALRDAADTLGLPSFRVPAPTASAEQAAATEQARLDEEAAHEDAAVDDGATTRIPVPTAAGIDSPHPTTVDVHGHYRPPPTRTADLPDDDHDDEEQDDEPEYPELARRRRMRRLVSVWVAAIVLVTLLIAAGAWYLGSGRWVSIPGIDGMDRPTAVRTLESVDLAVTARDRYDDHVPRQQPLGTDPAAGTRVHRGSGVVLFVSAGRPTVPNLTPGSSWDSVRTAMEERTLQLVEGDRRHDDAAAPGSVLVLDPGPGTTVAVGSTVTAIVSDGPRPVTLPDLRGLVPEDARRVLEAVGLRVADTTRARFDGSTDGGTVIQALPGTGREVPRGSEVTLEVSNARTVPDVHGKSQDEATALLERAGFVVVRGGGVDDTGVRVGQVSRTEPAAGSRVDPDSPRVTLRPSETVQVPDLRGLTTSEARGRLADIGLVLDMGDRSGGIVLRQNPPAGESRRPGESVHVTLL